MYNNSSCHQMIHIAMAEYMLIQFDKYSWLFERTNMLCMCCISVMYNDKISISNENELPNYQNSYSVIWNTLAKCTIYDYNTKIFSFSPFNHENCRTQRKIDRKPMMGIFSIFRSPDIAWDTQQVWGTQKRKRCHTWCKCRGINNIQLLIWWLWGIICTGNQWCFW